MFFLDMFQFAINMPPWHCYFLRNDATYTHTHTHTHTLSSSSSHCATLPEERAGAVPHTGRSRRSSKLSAPATEHVHRMKTPSNTGVGPSAVQNSRLILSYTLHMNLAATNLLRGKPIAAATLLVTALYCNGVVAYKGRSNLHKPRHR